MRKTPEKVVGRRSHSCSTKKKKNESFETAQEPDMDINTDDNNDDDLSDDSDDPHSLLVNRSKKGESNIMETVRGDERIRVRVRVRVSSK